MPLTAPPTIPLITDPSTFAVRAQDWVVWQAEQLYPALVEESLTLGLSLSGSSVTSNTVGAGSKSFTVETGKGFAAGQSIVIADSATPTNRMFGVVDTYDSGIGALVFISQAFEGSGTLTAWTISPTLNAVITAAQVPDGLITNAKLAEGYINDLTAVTFDPTVDYVPIADGSDAGNKKKALLPVASETAIGLVESATDAEAQAFTANKFIDGAKLNTALKGSNQSLAASGYQKLPGGLIIQWATVPTLTNNTGTDLTFPIAFPTAVVSISATAQVTSDGDDCVLVYRNLTTSGVRIINTFSSTSAGGRYFAIGY